MTPFLHVLEGAGHQLYYALGKIDRHTGRPFLFSSCRERRAFGDAWSMRIAKYVLCRASSVLSGWNAWQLTIAMSRLVILTRVCTEQGSACAAAKNLHQILTPTNAMLWWMPLTRNIPFVIFSSIQHSAQEINFLLFVVWWEQRKRCVLTGSLCHTCSLVGVSTNNRV